MDEIKDEFQYVQTYIQAIQITCVIVTLVTSCGKCTGISLIFIWLLSFCPTAFFVKCGTLLSLQTLLHYVTRWVRCTRGVAPWYIAAAGIKKDLPYTLLFKDFLDGTAASNLDPTLPEDDVQDLVKTSLASVVSCVPDDEEHNLLMMEKTLMALGDLLRQLLIKDMTVKTLDVLIQVGCPMLFMSGFLGMISNKCIAVRKVATLLWELTCHMGSHSVTCHPAEVTFPPLPQPKLVLD